jgi:hemerythrin-like domain-containing protein
MHDALQPFLQEHDRIRRMLKCFDAQLAIFERAEQPDYEVLSESLAYCRDYLDVWHHPREDRMLDLMQVRNGKKAASMSALGEQHRDLAETTARVMGVFNDVAQRGAIRLRETLVGCGRELSTTYRHHLDWEENNFFPLALAVLQPCDWEALDGESAQKAAAGHPDQLSARYPALFGAVQTVT